LTPGRASDNITLYQIDFNKCKTKKSLTNLKNKHMNWYVSHRVEWTDILALNWKIEIEKTTSSTPVLMQANDVPLKIDYLTKSDNLIENPIKGSTAEFTVYSDTNFQWVDIYSSYDLEKRVSIYHSDTTLFWRGFITPGDYSEPYDGVSYAVKISASDCLGFLKNLDYDNSGNPYAGRRLVSQIILDILAKIQVVSFTEFVNMYEDDMLQTVDDSPMDQEELDVDLFLGLKCYEVLEIICKKYNSIIRQEAGVYIIYRPYELVNSTLYGRVFTAATTKTSTSRSPLQYISRLTNESDVRDVEGGTMLIQQQASSVTIKQDYGNKESWIDNYNFKSNSLNYIGAFNYSVASWSKANSCQIRPITMAMPSETDGILITSQNAYPTVNTFIYQSFGVDILASTDVCYFEFDYLMYNFSNTDRTGEEFYVYLQAVDYSHYLYGVDANNAAWSDTPTRFEITADAPVGTTGWTTYKNKVPGIPVAGPYTIMLAAINNAYADVCIGFKNIRFYCVHEDITIKFRPAPKAIGDIGNWRRKLMLAGLNFVTKSIVERTYFCDNHVPGPPIEYDVLLGDVTDSGIDNVIEQFQGSSGKLISSVLSHSESWSTRGTAEHLTSNQLICNELGWQYKRAKQLIALPIMEGDSIDNIPHVDLLGRYEDDLNKIDGVNRMFVLSRGSFSVRDRMWDIDIVEVIPPAATYTPEPITYQGYGALYNWYAVNGE
jgi:hypothetical protein